MARGSEFRCFFWQLYITLKRRVVSIVFQRITVAILKLKWPPYAGSKKTKLLFNAIVFVWLQEFQNRYFHFHTRFFVKEVLAKTWKEWPLYFGVNIWVYFTYLAVEPNCMYVHSIVNCKFTLLFSMFSQRCK